MTRLKKKRFLHAVHQALDPFSTTRTNKNYRSDPAVVGKKKPLVNSDDEGWEEYKR